MRVLKSLLSRLRRIDSIESRAVYLQEALGRIEARQTGSARTLREAEFRVFSQWGEDGIIQFLSRHVPIDNKTFVEFGVQDYLESNTRFLVVKDNWSGLIIDGSAENIGVAMPKTDIGMVVGPSCVDRLRCNDVS